MKKNRNTILVICVLIIITSIVGILIYIKNAKVNTNYIENAMFLKHKGEIYFNKDDESINLTLLFLDNKNSELYNELKKKLNPNKYILEPYQIYDKEKNVDIYIEEINKGSEYKDAALYSVNVKVDLKGNNNYTISDLTILDKIYDIGDIYIEKVEQGKELNILSNIGSAKVLSKYDVEMTNKFNYDITSINIESKKFDSYITNIDYLVDQKQVSTIKKNDKFNIIVNFKDSENNYDVFYFGLKINYSVNGEKKITSTPYCMYGLPLTEEKISELYKKYATN